MLDVTVRTIPALEDVSGTLYNEAKKQQPSYAVF